ncbi:DUF6243 family protein [Streptomyces sp. NBC_01591]|uniref:DUF6243 family protein n=1 Tax=Streptomyces sp. NBC_01591 TaxID=2975888 RepID=UPI002DDAD99A|nr:DUF6243 family protein [Streptomyces sp. NBC_01591]WSD68375.1 DUF6243 family protein [Streptomyces sp. NBC_01591]
MAKSRNNLLGVGGQRKKLSRAEQQGAGPARDADRKTAADQKQELLRKMRERAQSGTASESSSDDAAQPDAPEQDAPAQS